MLIDSHVHLQDRKFASDLDRVLERAEDAGIEHMICIGDRLESSRGAIALASRYPQITAAIGVHPHYDALLTPETLDELDKLAGNNNVVAIGEIGLDYHYANFNPKRQLDVFTAQAALARRHNLPIVIHCRDAYDELIAAIRDDSQIARNGVVHCFSGNYEQARTLIDLGFYLGIGGAVTYSKSDDLRAVVRNIGLARVLSETDAPYLPPQLKRGRRNEPSYMKHTIQALADAAGLSYQKAAEITRANAIDLFGLAGRIEKARSRINKNQLHINITAQMTVDELFSQIANPLSHREIVLNGVDESIANWSVCLELARRLKATGARVTLSTNGLVSLAHGRDIASDMAGRFDCVIISLEAHNYEAYSLLAQSDNSRRKWDALLDFIRSCKNFVPEVVLELIMTPEVDIEACRRLAEDELRVRLRMKDFVSDS